MIEWLGSSYFSILEGVSAPEELISEAKKKGYQGIALADRLSYSGLVGGLRGKKSLSESISSKEAPFFYAPGIRLHFDQADPLFIYPLHKKAYFRLCEFLSAWSLEGMTHQEKGMAPLKWVDFKSFLTKLYKTRSSDSIAHDFVLISVSGRFYPYPTEERRVITQDTDRCAPSFCSEDYSHQVFPFWLLELVDICGKGQNSALSLAYPLSLAPGIEDLRRWILNTSQVLQIPILATSMPLFTHKEDQDLCDLVTAIRFKKRLKDLGYLRQVNGLRCLLSTQDLLFFRRVFEEEQTSKLKTPLLNCPFQRTHDLAQRHHFCLSELKYTYPKEKIPPSMTSSEHLASLVWKGAQERYPRGIPTSTHQQITKELGLIAQLQYEDYFLTIWEVLDFARKEEILFQGRGSAANSVVCFCLGITSIDPVRMDLLFERFISLERQEPPDIDVDFEHERREEVIQEIYSRYGRDHAGMVCSYICFKDRMAFRESAKAMGFELATIDHIAKFMGRDGMRRLFLIDEKLLTELDEFQQKDFIRLKEVLDTHRISAHKWNQTLLLAKKLKGRPRHIGLHTGGFVLSNQKLSHQCVLETARKKDRSIVPWDKDDLEFIGWMKVDLLSLGMLTAIRKSFDYIAQNSAADSKLKAIPTEQNSKKYQLSSVPPECPRVYKALQQADTVGVFQVESRAQMNMLPRLAPKIFYDIVVEVAIVRPGPLQGGMVHPYIRRRQGLEAVEYEHPDLEPILKKTLGVSIFQEQVMKIAVAVAGFKPGEADLLRKAMSGAWRSKSQMYKVRQKLLSGMAAKNISKDLAERLYKQIEGFGEYGFPESHAASFALLTYISTWLKVHHPSQFLCALINSQPMGFYSPRALVLDAQNHGVQVLPVDLCSSRWDCTLEENPSNPQKPFMRLGFRLIKALSQKEVELICELQEKGILCHEKEVPSLREMLNLGVKPDTLNKLIKANAIERYETKDLRSEQIWELAHLKESVNTPTLGTQIGNQDIASLTQVEEGSASHIPLLTKWQALLKDYQSFSMSLDDHPAAFARKNFFSHQAKWTLAEDLYFLAQGAYCTVLGLLTVKQRPPTAGGVTFLTLEDESGFANLSLQRPVYEKHRNIVEGSPLIAAYCRVSRSSPLDKRDPKTAAISLEVKELWNPFVVTSAQVQGPYDPQLTRKQMWGKKDRTQSQTQKLDTKDVKALYKARHYH